MPTSQPSNLPANQSRNSQQQQQGYWVHTSYGNPPVNAPDIYAQLNREYLEADKAKFNSWNPTENWQFNNEQKKGPQGQDLPKNAIGWQPNGDVDYGTGLGGWWRKITGKAQDEWQKGWEGGLKFSVAANREDIQHLEDVTDEMAKKEGSENVAFANAATRAAYSVFGSIIDVGLSTLGYTATKAEQVIGSTAYAIADTIKGEDVNWKRNWEASRMLYAGLFDASVFSQMERLLDSGVEGRFAEQMVIKGNKTAFWAELVGEMIFDPLNLVSVFTKGAKAVQSVKKAEGVFHAVENPVIRELIENADTIKQMDNTAAYNKINEVVKTQQGLNAVTAHADNIVKSADDIEKLSKAYNMSSLTSTGKLSHLANETSSVLMHIVNNSSSTDDALEILAGMVRSVSVNPEVAQDGVSAMLHFSDAPALFSKAGNDTTVLLSRMTEKYGDDWLKTIEDLRGNPQELTKELLRRLDDVGQEMFPSVTKMREADEAVKAAKTADQISSLTPAQRKLSDAYNKLPKYVKSATKMHDAAQKVVAPLNRGFAGVYMGWSPGYAFRNWMNNSLQMFIDQGPKSFWGNADEMFDSVKNLHGGILEAPGGFVPVTGETITDAGKTGITDIAKQIAGETKVFGPKAQGPAQIAGAVAEQNAAKRIFATEYKRTFDKSLKAMMKDMAPKFKEAGFSDDFIARLPTYIYENMGDTTAVMNAVRRDSKLGVIDMFNNVDRIDPKFKDFLTGWNKWGDYESKVLKAASKEEAMAAARKIFDDMAAISDTVYSETKSATSMFEQTLKFFGTGQNGLPDTRAVMLSHRVKQSDSTMAIADDLVKKLDSMVSKYSAETGQAIDLGTLKDQHGISGILPASEARNEAHIKTNLINEAYREIKSGNADLRKIWNKYPEFFNNQPFPAQGVVKDDMVNQMWTAWDKQVTGIYGKGRDLTLDRLNKYSETLRGLGVEIPDEELKSLNEAREYAAELDRSMVGPNGWILVMPEAEMAKPFGTRTSEIADLANKYGISSATAGGAPNNRTILNIISKHAKVSYRSLEEVPPAVAEWAFKARAGLTTGIEQFDEAVTVAGRFGDKGSPFADFAKRNIQMNPAEFSDVFGGVQNIDKMGVPPGFIAKEGAGLGIDDIGTRLAESGYITAEQAQDTNYVREFLRSAVGAGGETKFSQTVDVIPDELKKALDTEAQDLIKKVDEGGVPSFITKNLRRIAGNNGVEITDDMNATDVINALRSKVEAPKVPDEFRNAVDTNLKGLKEDLGNLKSPGEMSPAEYRAARDKETLDYLSNLDRPLKPHEEQLLAELKNKPDLPLMDVETLRGMDIGEEIDIFKFLYKKAQKAIDELADLGLGIDDVGKKIKGVGEDIRSLIDEGKLHDPSRPYFDDAGNLVEPKIPGGYERLIPPLDENGMMQGGRVMHEQLHGVKEIRNWMMNDINTNFGRKLAVDPVSEKQLRGLETIMKQRIAETRLISERVAKEARDFTLLNYGEKSYWDVALAYIYPYHFWYKGTYKNWMNRVFTNPSVLSHYERYKENLGNYHAGMPEWWKYNLNTNDIPGVNVENPMYFNLEATLWPLNGITGTDFNDPMKRTGWWTSTLDFASKFGPSVWTPINLATGLALYAQGNKDAGERWMGRLIPQTATIKAAGSMLGIANLETDPLVKFLQGGLDPYERRRVERSLAEMEQDVINGKLPYTREQIQDAAYSHEGPIWDEAVKRAVHGRSLSQMSSFFAGVGFKGRTKEDMQIDMFYTDYNRFWSMRPNLSPQEWREGMNQLQQKYPFMDTVLLSRRDETARDAGLAYLVLNRIPPGQTTDIAKAAGLDPKLVDKFFQDKGQIDNWSPADQQSFMGGVLAISAVLEIPQDMTRTEWVNAKNAYTTLTDDAKNRFGENILDTADGYFAAKTKGPDAATAYLDEHPEVNDYMNWRAERIMGSPLLAAYYGGASMIEGYYKSKMYADIEKQLGPEIYNTMDEYNSLKTYGTPEEQKAFYRLHKGEIQQYYELKDAWTVIVDQQVSQVSAHIPEGEGAQIREDVDMTSPTQQGLVNAMQPQEQMTFQDFQQVIPNHILSMVADYQMNGIQMTESAEKQLGRLAQDLGYPDAQTLIQAIGTSMVQSQGQPQYGQTAP